MRRVVLLVLWALVLAPVGEACAHSFVTKQFDQLVTEAEDIFVGTITGEEARKIPAGAIVTDVTFSDLRVIKGAAGRATIVLMVLGGTVGDETLEVAGLPELHVGQRYVVFSTGNGKTIFPVVGGEQGLFRVLRDPSTGLAVVGDARGNPLASPPVTLDDLIQAIGDRLPR